MASSAVCFIGALFLRALWHKLQDTELFIARLEAYRVLPPAVARSAGWAILALEVLVMLSVILPGLRLVGTHIAVILLLAYASAMALNIAKGRTDLDCGCGSGSAGPTLSWYLVVRNLVLATIAAVPLFTVEDVISWYGWLIAFLAALLLFAVYLLFEQILANTAHSGIPARSDLAREGPNGL